MSALDTLSSARLGRAAVQDGLIGANTSPWPQAVRLTIPPRGFRQKTDPGATLAFISSLGANLRLDCASPLPSPGLTPSTPRKTTIKSSPLLGPTLPLPTLGPSLISVTPPPESKEQQDKPPTSGKSSPRSRSSSGSKHQRIVSRRQQQDPLLPANYRVQHVTSPEAKQRALHVVAKTVSWTQTLLAIYSFTTHPLTLLGFLFCLLLIERCVQPAVLRTLAAGSNIPSQALRKSPRSITNASSRLRLANGGDYATGDYAFSMRHAELASRMNQQVATLQRQALSHAHGHSQGHSRGAAQQIPDANGFAWVWTFVGSAWIILSVGALVVVVWYVWRPYERLAQEVEGDQWLSDDDVMLVLRDTNTPEPDLKDDSGGGKIIGTLILSWQSRETSLKGGQGQRKRRAWRGWIRAWAVQSGYRGRGLGSALLREATRMLVAKGNGEGLWFAEDHAREFTPHPNLRLRRTLEASYSSRPDGLSFIVFANLDADAARVLGQTYNGAFERRERRARELLAGVVQDALPCSSWRKR